MEILALMRKRDQALEISLKSKTNTDIIDFKSLRNKVVKEMYTAKPQYYTRLTENAWKHMYSLVNPKPLGKKLC